ncbi:MAG: hypothetical protein ILP13_04195 [Lachnospiraceae bacterium]|nr:hypothetical protein [Lachnospiraceae bacterium]
MDEERSFEEILINGTADELNELKRWLFEENIRLSAKQKELNEFHERFLQERIQFQDEMKAINLRNVNERKRLKDEETFFDKKMEILKNGFAQLEIDRKAFEKEKKQFYYNNAPGEDSASSYSSDFKGSLFAGVNNMLALKKRYRDLLKIFHPDNLCGDNEMVAALNREYDRLKKKFDYPFRSAK